MPVLYAAVALVGALGLLNLLLTFGVLRRLREHAAMLREGTAVTPPVVRLAAGERPDSFSAVSVTGKHIGNSTELHVVAFFSTACSICAERIEPFAEYLADRGIGPDRVLAVIAQEDGTPAPFQQRLEQVATVCAEPADGAVASAFRVSGFPAFCLLGADGALLASGYDPAMLPTPAGV
jgi:hypothetical protein